MNRPQGSKKVRIIVAFGLATGLVTGTGGATGVAGTPSELTVPGGALARDGDVSYLLEHAGQPLPAATRLSAGSSRTEVNAVIDACVQQQMSDNSVPGSSVAVIDDGKLIYEQGYGVKHATQGGAVDANSLFRFGSLEKMLTAAALMQQVELGRVDLSAPVTRYIPEFQVAPPRSSNEITVYDLLMHSSSFPDRYDSSLLTPMDEYTYPTALSDWAGEQGNIPLHAVPGAFFNYSNPGYSLLGLIVERVSGIEYHEYMRDYVFGPAGMNATTLYPDEALAYGDYTYGHYVDPETERPVIAAPDAYDDWRFAPAGMAFTRARDLAQFALALMNDGAGLISPASARALESDGINMKMDPWQAFYGYGVVKFPDYQGLKLNMHDGSVLGWTSSMMWVPARKFAVVVLNNINKAPDAAALCILQSLVGLNGQVPANNSSPSSTWSRYTGTYKGRYYGWWYWRTRGLVKYDGLELTAKVSLRKGQLTIDVPALNVTDQLIPTGLDNFSASRALTYHTFSPLTFVEDPARPGHARWIRNHSYVLELTSQTTAPAGASSRSLEGPCPRAGLQPHDEPIDVGSRGRASSPSRVRFRRHGLPD